MSRSGYSDDEGGMPLGLYRAVVQRAIDGGRGQKFLHELLAVLDGMEDKRLYPNSFITPEGGFCTLGAMAQAKAIDTERLGEKGWADIELTGKRFNIAECLAAEIMYLNDEYFVKEFIWEKVTICGPMRVNYPDWGRHVKEIKVKNDNAETERWQKMREWVLGNIKETK